MEKILFKYVIVFVLLFTVSCSSYQKLLKSDNYDVKYNSLMKYYDQQDYFKSLQLLDGLLAYYRGTDKAEKLLYLYPFCYYGQGDYIIASYHFANYVRTYPKGKKAIECAFMAAYCKYLDSPNYSLDQSNTYEAINELQMFINKYPGNDRTEECNNLIDELRDKLHEKAYRIAELYYKTKNYRAAVYAYNNVIKDYPDTKYKEVILFNILNSNYIFAHNSIEAKKKERFKTTLKSYNSLIASFPESKNRREVVSIYKNIEKEISN